MKKLDDLILNRLTDYNRGTLNIYDTIAQIKAALADEMPELKKMYWFENHNYLTTGEQVSNFTVWLARILREAK